MIIRMMEWMRICVKVGRPHVLDTSIGGTFALRSVVPSVEGRCVVCIAWHGIAFVSFARVTALIAIVWFA